MTVKVKLSAEFKCTGAKDCSCCYVRPSKKDRGFQRRSERRRTGDSLRRYVGRI